MKPLQVHHWLHDIPQDAAPLSPPTPPLDPDPRQSCSAEDHGSAESDASSLAQTIIDRVHRKVAILQQQITTAEAAYNQMITAADGFRVFALTVHDELKEETEQLELYIRIGRKNGIFQSSCDVCPCVRTLVSSGRLEEETFTTKG